MHELRKRFQGVLRRAKLPEDVGLHFGGGMDSLCILFSMFDLGIRPTLYTYCVRGVKNRDLRNSMAIAKQYGLTHRIGWVDPDMNAVLATIRFLIVEMDITVPVPLQCMHGQMYLVDKVTQSVCVHGAYADGSMGSARRVCIQKARHDKVWFDRWRREMYDGPNTGGAIVLTRLYKRYGKRVFFPYFQHAIRQYFMHHTWAELNRPRYKQHMLDAFPETEPWYRQRESQQVASGIRAIHRRLLLSNVNEKNRKAPHSFYKDLKAHWSA